ncbi:MAG: integrase arm-type DNA-binding domain-containing protein [Xanthobacteraceae bacterium]|nr:integrase arm-type DNA-binding domain-containing protein [Xanthobacteraceae bacterium]
MAGRSSTKNGLTHRTIETLQPRKQAYRVSDVRCPGLGIRVAPSGLKSWDAVFRIRGSSTVRRKALGAFPAVSLEDARKRAVEIGRAAQAGRDLVAEERAAKEAAAARMTVDELVADYVKRACGKLRTKHEIELRLRRALASIKNRPAEEIRRRDIRQILNATADRGVLREAEKQRQSIGAMFAYAVGQDIVAENPVRGLKSYSPGELRDRILSPGEIKIFWDWLATSDLNPDVADALRLQLCLGARIGEVAGLNTEEIDRVSWIWTLPALRSKNKKPRVTPIVDLAKEILEKRFEKASRGPLFKCENGRILTSNDVACALVNRRRRMPLEHFVSHDLRRTVATGLVDLGIAHELVASIIGHESGDKSTRILTRHYIRTDAIERKRVALEAWNARLRATIGGSAYTGKVVSLTVHREGMSQW